ncbi:MAG: type II toxin-antitoxin system HicB family antitoxin [Isosphaeraceae bacterium]
MAANYTAVIQKHGEWWIGWVEEVPGVNSQGQTREELLDNLRDALEEALVMNRAEARAAASGAFEEVSIPARGGASHSSTSEGTVAPWSPRGTPAFVVGQPGQRTALRSAAAHGNPRPSLPEDLPGPGHSAAVSRRGPAPNHSSLEAAKPELEAGRCTSFRP